MKTYLECVPCYFRQCIEALEIAGATQAQKKQAIDELGSRLKEFKIAATPPEVEKVVHDIIRLELGIKDPYQSLKKKSNFWAKGIYHQLKKDIRKSKDPLLTALKVGGAGNLIDYGTNSGVNLFEQIDKALRKDEFQMVKEQGELFRYSAFVDNLKESQNLLYLADNAGEVVFDKLLIEEIKELYPHMNVTFAVRDTPIINDATMEDALQCGLDSVARVMSSGCGTPGTLLSESSNPFRKVFKDADMVIGKGQGNYAALQDASRDKMAFLFIIKCPFVARELGSEVRTMILI